MFGPSKKYLSYDKMYGGCTDYFQDCAFVKVSEFFIFK